MLKQQKLCSLYTVAVRRFHMQQRMDLKFTFKKKIRTQHFTVKYKTILYFKARLATLKETGAPPSASCVTGRLAPSFGGKTGRSLPNPITQR